MSSHIEDQYIHGSAPEEQQRLALLNDILNVACLDLIGVEPGESVLDIGSGLGGFTRLLARTAGRKAIGVERDPNQLEAARAEASLAHEEHLAEFRQGNAYDLPLSSQELAGFDLVHCRFVLEHLAFPENAVLQMYTACRPGGRIVLMDDDHSLFRLNPIIPSMETLWSAYCDSYVAIGNDPFIGRKLVSLLKQAGCNQVQMGVTFFGCWAGDQRFPMYVENLRGILVGARDLMLEHNLVNEREFDTGMRDFERWSEKGDAAIWYPLNYAIGKK